MKRILIWGTEKVYDQYINALKYQELLGNIKVIGVTSEYYSYECVDGYSFVDVENIDYLSFDILVVAARRKEERFKDILSKARQNNILEENILPIEVFAIPGFTVEKYLYLARGGVSIMACNCWGGMTYHSLSLPFLTPFINVFENEWDYLKIMENLHYYMGQKICFAYQHKDEAAGVEWPVGRLDDVLIHFRHSKTFEEGRKDWIKRKERINYDNIFAMMYTESYEVARRFESLPYKKKVCFVPFITELPSVHTLKILEDDKKRPKKLWDIVNALGEQQIKEYDIWRLLMGFNNYDRVVRKR